MSLNNDKELLKRHSKELSDLFLTETEEFTNERKTNLMKLINSIPDGEKIEKLAKELKENITVKF